MALSTNAPAAALKPRERLLATASDLFYREGIHSVGVDRIVAEAGVTRATFYRHFPGKEDLVRAYLVREDDLLRQAFASAAQNTSPDDMVGALITGIADDVERNHTRGCAFINASAEYPDADSPVRQTITEHREWMRATFEAMLAADGHPDPAEGARALVLLRDAALVGGYLDGSDTIRSTFERTARGVTAH